jgi:epoxyqueuosine reductase QueG
MGERIERTVTVCDACLQASCWQGHFYCDEYRTAGTKELTISELKKLGREHSSYWKPLPGSSP